MRLFGEEKTRYRLYKSGKLWLVALIGVFALAIGHQPSHVKASSVATRTATLAVQPATLGQELNLNNQQTINADSPTSSNEVVVKCVDDAGNTLVKDTVLQGEVGKPYTIKPATIANYQYAKLANGSAPINGTFSKGTLTVTLVYTKVPVTQRTVNVKYVDEHGNEIAPATTLTGTVGGSYTAVPANVKNYEYAHLAANSAPEKGSFTANPQTVTFVYTEKPAAQGSVTERFVDEAGKRIAPDKTLTGQVGDLYEARPIEISDYAFSRVAQGSAPAGNTFINGNVIVTFVYKRVPATQGSVTVRYVDENGNELAPNKVLTGQSGSAYTTGPITINGYRYVRLAADSAAASGTFPKDTGLVVSFVYTKPAIPVMPTTPETSTVLSTSSQSATTEVITPSAQRRLPNTNEKHEDGIAAVGLALLSLMGLGSTQLFRKAKRQ